MADFGIKMPNVKKCRYLQFDKDFKIIVPKIHWQTLVILPFFDALE